MYILRQWTGAAGVVLSIAAGKLPISGKAASGKGI